MIVQTLSTTVDKKKKTAFIRPLKICLPLALGFLLVFLYFFRRTRLKSSVLLPASDHASQLKNCDLQEGIAKGIHPLGYTFFTFDPGRDKHVSAGMIATEGLYDAHIHAALDVSLEKSKSSLCDAILDVGSNLGTLALYAGAKGKGCPVHAFEMQPAVACRLEMSIKASGFSHVTLHRAAVSSISGKLYSFNTLPSNPGGVGLQQELTKGTAGETTVGTVNLDEMFIDKSNIVFMKIDTEGHEFEVLKSAKQLLKEQKIKNIVVEIRSDQVEMVEFMYKNGYTCDLIKVKQRKWKLIKAKPSCRNSMENVMEKVKRILHFDDMFCCVS